MALNSKSSKRYEVTDSKHDIKYGKNNWKTLTSMDRYLLNVILICKTDSKYIDVRQLPKQYFNSTI